MSRTEAETVPEQRDRSSSAEWEWCPLMRVIAIRSRQLSALLILLLASSFGPETKTEFPGTLTENVCPVFCFFSTQCRLSNATVTRIQVACEGWQLTFHSAAPWQPPDRSSVLFVCLFLTWWQHCHRCIWSFYKLGRLQNTLAGNNSVISTSRDCVEMNLHL